MLLFVFLLDLENTRDMASKPTAQITKNAKVAKVAQSGDDMDAELAKALELARALDEAYQPTKTPLDAWLEKFAPDPWALKPKKIEGGGEVAENGLYYPDAKNLRDAEDLRKWAKELRKDVLGQIVKNPDVTTDQLRATLSTWPEHQDLINYYSIVFECIAQRVMRPPYYMQLLDAMCDAQTKIKGGADPIAIELQLDQIKRDLKVRFGELKET